MQVNRGDDGVRGPFVRRRGSHPLVMVPGAAVVVLAGFGVVFGAVPARADIVQCRDTHGVVILSPDGSESACPAARAAARPVGANGVKAGDPRTATSPASFPRVEATVQRQRDGDRALILRSELESQQARAKQLDADLQRSRRSTTEPSPDVRTTRSEVEAQLARTLQNVVAIQREISGLR